MFEHPSNRSELIQSESPLTAGYTPAEPINRTQEVDRIAEAVRPLTRRQTPENLLVYGPAGVGKTTVTRHVLEELTDRTRVTTAYINCWQYNTRPSLLTELLIQLGYPAPRKGKPVDQLVAKLAEWLDKHYGTVVALDEFDQLADQATVVYDLQELSTATGGALGLIMISNQPSVYLDLESRSQSRVAYRPVEIRPYTKQELAEILEHRIDSAFHPETVSDNAITQIAATVAAQNGDCRRALTCLLQAARLAEQEGAAMVTVEHVDQCTLTE